MTEQQSETTSQEPMQSPAKTGGVGSTRQEINMGTSPPHPENTPQADPLPDHIPSTPEASKDGPQDVDLTPAMSELPQHVLPLLGSIKRYPVQQQDEMGRELIRLCTTVWKERLDLWARTHPIRNKVQREHVPPVVYEGGQFYWVNRRQRRAQR
jgi:hypothetical protein